MGFFKKKTSTASFGNYGDYKYEIKYKKCVGYVDGKLEYFWGVKKITEIEKKTKKGIGLSEFYRAEVPATHQGLPVRVILCGALKSAPPFSLFHADNLIAIDCNQGDSYGYGPFLKFGIGEDHLWEGAIFTYDENDPMFAPLAFHPSDITYGLIATYWNESVYRSPNSTSYGEWLVKQLQGDGKAVNHRRDNLFNFKIFKGAEPDWDHQQRFLVKEVDKHLPFFFKCTDETSSEIYLTY